MSYVAAGFIVVGAAFCALAALGILRFPDVYTRLHAASNAALPGAGLILLGAGVASGDPMVMLRAAFGFVFIVLTAPVSAHLLARAAIKSGARTSEITSIDEYVGKDATVQD